MLFSSMRFDISEPSIPRSHGKKQAALCGGDGTSRPCGGALSSPALPSSFDIPFDRQQLADYLCIDRAAMSTEISKLQKEGFIKTNRNHFELTVCNNSDSEIKM